MLAEFAAHLRVGNGLHHGAEDVRADFPPVQRGGIEQQAANACGADRDVGCSANKPPLM